MKLNFIIFLLLRRIIGQEQCQCSDFTTNQYCVQYEFCAWNGKNCYQPNCTDITNQSNCQAPTCAWYLEKCHDGQSCNYYTDKSICNQVYGCVANDGYCLPYEDCSFPTKDKCQGTTPSGIQCFWNEVSESCIKYTTCNHLSLDNNDCNSVPYCFEQKKQCVNFNKISCSDMDNHYDCYRMAPYQCTWYENKCQKFLCSTYTDSSACTLNSCNWNGSECVYCPLENSQSKLITFIVFVINIILN